jgi:hypothetical protein
MVFPMCLLILSNMLCCLFLMLFPQFPCVHIRNTHKLLKFIPFLKYIWPQNEACEKNRESFELWMHTQLINWREITHKTILHNENPITQYTSEKIQHDSNYPWIVLFSQSKTQKKWIWFNLVWPVRLQEVHMLLSIYIKYRCLFVCLFRYGHIVMFLNNGAPLLCSWYSQKNSEQCDVHICRFTSFGLKEQKLLN